jgi:hypothetical protein
VLPGSGLCAGSIPHTGSPIECVYVVSFSESGATITLYTYNEQLEETRLKRIILQQIGVAFVYLECV